MDGKYELITRLGEGGMGSVLKARQIELDRIVAIKFMHPMLVQDNEWLKRFEQEARALAGLTHKNIARFYCYGVTESRTAYIVMEMVEGKPLTDLIENETTLEEKQCVEIGLQLARALGYVHANEVVHRDLKPDNVILDTSNGKFWVKLVDFGLSKSLNAEGSLTATGQLIGSPDTMSPEQCQGQKADARSDVYSLGCLLFMIACGRSPFESDSAIGLIYKHQNETAPFPARRRGQPLSADFCQIISKMLEKNPNDRYQSMDEVADALSSINPAIKFKCKSSNLHSFSVLAALIGTCLIIGMFAFRTVPTNTLINEIELHERKKEFELESHAIGRLISKKKNIAIDKLGLAAELLDTALEFERRKYPVASMTLAKQSYKISSNGGTSLLTEKIRKIKNLSLDIIERTTLSSDHKFKSLMQSVPAGPVGNMEYICACLKEAKLGYLGNMVPETLQLPLIKVWSEKLAREKKTAEIDELVALIELALKSTDSSKKEYIEFLLDLSALSRSESLYCKAKDELQKMSIAGFDEPKLWFKAGVAAESLSLADETFRNYQCAYSAARSMTQKAFYAAKLAEWYLSRRDPHHAESFAKESIQICEEEAFFLPLSKCLLGDCYLMQRNISKARNCYTEAIAANRDAWSIDPDLGVNSISDISDKNHLYPALGLMSIYKLQGTEKKARQVQKAALKYVAARAQHEIYARRLLELETLTVHEI